MITQELFFTLITFYFVMFLTPGPNNIMLTTSGIKYGFKRTIPHILGIPVGHFIQVLSVTMGLGVLFQSHPIIQSVLKILGCFYLFFLSYKIIGSLNIKFKKKDSGRPLKFYESFLFQFVNPKSWVATTTAVSIFFPKEENFFIGILFIVGIALIILIPSAIIWTIFGNSIKIFISNNKIKNVIELIMAGLLVVTGVIIIL